MTVIPSQRSVALPALVIPAASDAPTFSVVVPVHNEAESLPELHRRVAAVMAALGERWELVLVNDGSRDQSASVIAALCADDAHVRGVSLSRNFGFQAAATAGLDVACGRAIVMMDADLQDPPEVIPDMVAKWRQGYDVIYGVRSERAGETWFKRASASGFYRLIRSITNVDIPLDTGDFRLMDRRVLAALREMPEHHRFLRGMVSWVGFRQVGVAYKRQPRFAGSSTFTLGKMVRFALDAITSFSYVPLQLSTYIGFALALVSVLAILAVIGLRLFGSDQPLLGQATTLVSVLFLGSMQLMGLGVIGEYLGRMQDEVRHRPLYVVDRRWGFGDADEAVRSTPWE